MQQIRFPLAMAQTLQEEGLTPFPVYSAPQTIQLYLKGLLLRKGGEKEKA